MPTKLDTPSAKLAMEKIVALIMAAPEQFLTERELSLALNQSATTTLEYLRQLRQQNVVRVRQPKKERGAGRMPYQYTLGDVKDVAMVAVAERARKASGVPSKAVDVPVDPMRQFLFGTR